MTDTHADEESATEDHVVRGSLAVEDGRGVLRYDMDLPAPVDEVWAALTDPARLGDWYGRIDGDLRAGGRYRAHLFPSEWEGEGRVLACESRSLLRMESGEPGEAVTIDEVRLAPLSAERTQLHLDRVRPSADALDAYAVGTQLHLENLAAYLAGEAAIDPEPFWTALHPRYEALFAAERGRVSEEP